jgi:hypothetical protein
MDDPRPADAAAVTDGRVLLATSTQLRCAAVTTWDRAITVVSRPALADRTHPHSARDPIIALMLQSGVPGTSISDQQRSRQVVRLDGDLPAQVIDGEAAKRQRSDRKQRRRASVDRGAGSSPVTVK